MNATLAVTKRKPEKIEVFIEVHVEPILKKQAKGDLVIVL